MQTLAQDELSVVLASEITTPQRIAIRQIERLIESSDFQSAVTELQRLSDAPEQRFVSLNSQNESAAFRRWAPLRGFLQDRILRWGKLYPEFLQAYRRRTDSLAQSELQRSRDRKDLTQAIATADQYLATSYGDDAAMLVADLAIDRGHVHTARAYLRRIDTKFAAHGRGESSVDLTPTISWHHLIESHPNSMDALARELNREANAGFGFRTYSNSDLDQSRIAARIPYCSLVAGDIQRAERELKLFSLMFPDAKDSLDELQSWMDAAQNRDRQSTTPTVSKIPRWTLDLRQFATQSDTNSTEQAFQILPNIHGDKVLVQYGNQILGFDSRSGRSWPEPDAKVPIFESAYSFAESLPSDSLPFVSTAIFSLNAQNRFVTARIGPPVTGWLPVLNKSGPSATRLAVLDMSRQGTLLNSFPLVLNARDLKDYEFESAPLLLGDSLVTGITRREGSTYVSRVICYDLRTGRRRWLSPVLSTSPMLIDYAANRVSCSTVVHREGKLFYHASLGVVASLDLNGRVEWITEYPRGELRDDPFAEDSPTGHRSFTPILLDDEFAYVAPADCDRIFALDSATGQLLWSTGAGNGRDIHAFVGITDQHLIAAGEYLYWINKFTGDVDCTTTRVSSSGRSRSDSSRVPAKPAAMDEHKIYWCQDREILVYRTSLADREIAPQPDLVDRIDLSPLGLSAGNLVLSDQGLIIASSDRIALFSAL